MVKLPSKRKHPLLRLLLKHPWWSRTRHSPAVRRWLDHHRHITPHFSWRSYYGTSTDGVPHQEAIPGRLKANAIRLHWKLERMRHLMGDVPMVVDGPYRTPARNLQVGGASRSEHMDADAADFFADQVDEWVRESRKLDGRGDVLRIADRVFSNGGLGNENTGTLHVDARGNRARFVTWQPAGG